MTKKDNKLQCDKYMVYPSHLLNCVYSWGIYRLHGHAIPLGRRLLSYMKGGFDQQPGAAEVTLQQMIFTNIHKISQAYFHENEMLTTCVILHILYFDQDSGHLWPIQLICDYGVNKRYHRMLFVEMYSSKLVCLRFNAGSTKEYNSWWTSALLALNLRQTNYWPGPRCWLIHGPQPVELRKSNGRDLIFRPSRKKLTYGIRSGQS